MRNKFFLYLLIALLWQTSCHAVEDQWQERKTIHFVVFFKKAPSDFIKTVEVTAEQCYDEIVRNLGFYQASNSFHNDRIKIYIYDDQQDYEVGKAQVQGTQGVAYFRQKTIRSFPAAHGFFDSTLPHELGHIIFREFVGYHSDIPLWVDEGVAMFQEKARRWGAHAAVREAIEQKRFMPLEELSGIRFRDLKDREQMELFYAEAASLVYFMIVELGEYRFLNFCNNLKDGQGFDQAFKNSYRQFNDLNGLGNSWWHYLKKGEKQ